MSEQTNPLVKDSPEQTLNEIINTLQYVSTSLDKIVDEDDATQSYMSAAQAAGLRNIIDSLQNASEVCAGQCMKRGYTSSNV
ncbi:MAG: hypothetical protein ACI9FJ_000828 [Alteromonadaceae bacterium]|jgi:hypothetical protein